MRALYLFKTNPGSALVKLLCSACATAALLVGSAHADEHEKLALLLTSRFEDVQSLKWKFEYARLAGTPIDWRVSSYESDPFVDAKKSGIDAFQQVDKSMVSGTATFVEDRLFSINFLQNSQSFQTFFDGKVFAQRTPTVADGSDKEGPAVVEISETAAVGDLRGLALSVSGYHFGPMRIPQLRSCFGSEDESISLAEFVQLLQNENIEKVISVVNGKHVVTFKAFVEQQDAGNVEYTFDDDGFLGSVAWKAGQHWSASETVTYGESNVLNDIRLPATVTFVDWSNSAARKYQFSGWEVATMSDLGFEIPEGALVSDHVNGVAYTNTGGAANEARAAELYAMQNGLALPDDRSPTNWRRNGMIVLIIVASLIIFGSFLFRRHSAGKSNIAKIVIFLAAGINPVSTLDSFAQLVEEPGKTNEDFVRWNPGSGWVLQSQVPGMSHLSQCGSRSVMLALNLCGREFDPLYVSKELKPCRDGISMLDIKNVMVSHGVAVNARSSLSFDEVVLLAHQNELLIVHIPQYQRFGVLEPHYLVFFRNGNGDVMVLDPPFDPVNASATDTHTRSQLVGLTALLCSREKTTSPSWSPKTEEIVLTAASFKDDIFTGSVILENGGTGPIAIVRGQASCDCIQLDFSACEIRSGGTVELPIRIDKGQWGESQQKLRFVDAYGFEKYVVVSGKSFPVLPPALDVVNVPPIEFERDIAIPFEAPDAEHQHSFQVGTSVKLDGELVATDLPEGVAVDAGLSDDGSEIRGKVTLASEFVRTLSQGLPRFFACTLKADDVTVADVKFRVHRQQRCSVIVKSDDPSRYTLLCEVSSGTDWQLDSCDFPKLRVTERKQMLDGRFAIVLEQPITASSANDGAVLGVIRFSHNKYLPFEKVVTVRRKDEADR